tara:strand:+ start:1259 stop:2494 length:1236 start_codon:yes stop_codon:yes gene_type:complete
MASGWRKLLEEESEHQWLAIGLFFVFIIIGGFLIGGTSSLEGMVLGTDPSDELVFEEGEFILEIDYHEDASWSQAHSAILKTSTGLKMYQQMDSDDVDDILPVNDPGIENITFFSADEDGAVTFSSSLNTLSTYVNGMISNQILEDGYGSEFGITAMAHDSSSLLNNRLLVTSEDGGSGLRGLNGQGLVTTSSTIQNSLIWEEVVYLTDSTFLVAGTYTVQLQSQSPASPSTQIVLAHVYWDGDSTAPQVIRQSMGNGSEIHSISRTSGGGAVVASNEDLYIASVDSIETMNYPSNAMIYECKQHRVWLFGERGSESVLRIDLETGDASSKNLAYPFPLQATSGMAEGGTVYIHGFDAQGEADRISLDLSIEGSLSSGRGLLNFGFILVGVIMIATQAYMMVEKAMHAKKA